MNVEKIIRVLGYIVYTALWSPIIVLYILVVPLVWIGMYIRGGRSVREALAAFKNALICGVQHDMNFIRTGIW